MPETDRIRFPGMTSCSSRFLVVNGVPHTGDVTPVSSYLESIFCAYTTTRTNGNASVVLFWERHIHRLADSARILAESRPDSFSDFRVLPSPSMIRPLVEDSLRSGLRMALREKSNRDGSRGAGEELAITLFVRGGNDEAGSGILDAYVHIGFFIPQVFGAGARLALVGRGRDIAAAKHSEWVTIRKYMEKVRPPLVTELLLSNDGDQILEGSVTNFFVVCRKVVDSTIGGSFSNPKSQYSFEVQTAPLSDGLLPGIIRQLVIEICSSSGIPLREVAPSWSERELWEEAFVTSSLRLLQHVETIQAPTMWEELHLKTWEQVSWVEKQFEGPGIFTTAIQRALLERATTDGFPVTEFF